MPDARTGLRLRHVIREDAIGEFLRAEDPATGAPVCLRRMHERLATDESARLIFAEEVRRVSTLSDPSLLRVRRAEPSGVVPFMVTDPIDDGTLEDELRRSGPWRADAVGRLLRHLVAGLDQLESRKQFHAAPYPSRIVRVGDGWRLTTFREVRADDEAARLKGRAAPDPRFRAPELDEAHRAPVKARTLTAWHVGALWRWLRTSMAPDEGETPGVVGPEGAALERLLANEPALRPGTAASVRSLVEGACP